MALGYSARTVVGCGFAVMLSLAALSAATQQEASKTPLAIGTARVTISGTSNIHEYTASTTTVRLTRAALSHAIAGPDFWDSIVKPGAVDAFEIAIPAATLTSPKEGLDKNMRKALRVQEFADITFRLVRFETGAAGALKAIGVLKIAGVEREVALDIKTQKNESGLLVKGTLQLLMTDYGIKPPTAMLGMLKTDPKVTVSFETALTVPLT
jgi:polyisoprenoid-binding protein YceI